MSAEDFTPGFDYRSSHIDVFIAGAGPIGAVFAKKCVDAGLRVVMCELGAADSFTSKRAPGSNSLIKVPGYHKKNQIEYQKDIDRFVNVIKGALSTVSVPSSNIAIPTLDPASAQNSKDKPFISLGKNPNQNPFKNLGAEAVTRGVGGMSTHWTCATPRLNPYIERPKLDEDKRKDDHIWDTLYKEAEHIIGTSSHEFDESIRHNLVLRNLQESYSDPNKKPTRVFRPLPLACHRLQDPDYVEWHATDRILEELFTDPRKRQNFILLTNARCTKLNITKKGHDGYMITSANVTDLLPQTIHTLDSQHRGKQGSVDIKADVFVLAAGAVATAQILANSQKGFESPGPTEAAIRTPCTPNLGKYITEQPMTFCQVVLNKKIMDSVDKNPYHFDWWKKKVDEHVKQNPRDPIHIPFRDPEPQVTSPFSEGHEWHTQIHRDAFSYGAVAETIDTRLIVDFRFFGYVEPRKENKLMFQEHYSDSYDMPQPTFEFEMSEDDRRRARLMMADMCDMALRIGGYLPGSEPQFMTPGLALHLAGTVRAGPTKEDHVADTHCKVYDFDNLYVGGNGVIPTGFGANPTLTSICYAIRACEDILRKKKHQ